MTPYEAAEAYVREMNEKIAAKKDAIVNGSYKSLEDYKYECGILRGMLLALDSFKAHAAQME